MATTTSTGFSIPVASPALSSLNARAARRRITPEAGRALEILAHAIEYLADESVHERSGLSDRTGQLQAIHLLMDLNRQVYFECPEMLPLGERFRKFLHLS